MNILGINFLGHDASASLLCDGELVAAVEEERFFRRKKHYGGFPVNAIGFCLKKAGLSAKDIGHVGYYIDPTQCITPSSIHFALSPLLSLGNKIFFASRVMYYLTCKTLPQRLRKHFPGLESARLNFVRHHDAHMASSFFCSPFNEADIITLDGIGEWETTVFARGNETRITRERSLVFPHSIGYMYSAITHHLGFKVNNDEYKVMGLSGYGDPQRFLPMLRGILKLEPDGGYSISPGYFSYGRHWGRVSQRFLIESGLAPRDPESELLQAHKDMSAAIQTLTEELGVHVCRSFQAKTRSKNLCLAGGVALNCLMNAKILQETPYEDIYIQPAAYDASGSLGSALWIEHMVLNRPRRFQMDHVYYGYEATQTEIEEVLRRTPSIEWKRSGNIAQDAAEVIVDGKIVGWYQGRMEWGPRALGNRSILADPRPREMMDLVNDKVKFREDFRPFAPSCKIEAYRDYFDSPVPSPFMLLISDVLESQRQRIAAVTHTDGTARYHTVSKEINPRYWTLLDEVEKLTGIPIVLNTSFNVRGETIVMTPDDAVNCFLNCGIDVLAIGDFLVKKKAS